MTPAEILERAADVIDERGHCHGAFEKTHGVCTYGAINFVVTGNAQMCSLLTEPAEHAMRIANIWAIAAWNDSHTAAEVTSTMRAVAATLRAQEREPEPIELHTG